LNIERLLKEFEEKLAKLDYSGWDVFDGLNSVIFSKLPVNNSRKLRLIWLQLFKRSPVNFRRIAL
jgi:hypothetical protein